MCVCVKLVSQGTTQTLACLTQMRVICVPEAHSCADSMPVSSWGSWSRVGIFSQWGVEELRLPTSCFPR